MPSTQYLPVELAPDESGITEAPWYAKNQQQDFAFQEALAAAIARGRERKPPAKTVDYDDGRVRRQGNGG